jgi:hypothetical protein
MKTGAPHHPIRIYEALLKVFDLNPPFLRREIADPIIAIVHMKSNSNIDMFGYISEAIMQKGVYVPAITKYIHV